MDIEPKQINPKHRGDKFSPSLYRYFLRQRKLRPQIHLRVFKVTRKHAFIPLGTLLIGYLTDDGVFIGTQLAWTLRGTHNIPSAYPATAPRVTEVKGFWELYLKIGRCAIHHGDDHQSGWICKEGQFDYRAGGKVRTCKWCGHEQRKLRYEVTVKKEVTEWRDFG